MQNITHACFGLSYGLALLLELARMRWPLRGVRLAGLAMGAAGLFAHTVFLAFKLPTPASAYGALLAVAWVLAVFYLYGSIHHGRQAWAIFVLPVVLALVLLAFAYVGTNQTWESAKHFWGAIHGLLLLSAAVGVCVGAITSVMYLIQQRRLRLKLNPLGGLKMLSLERLESMNRRAINLAFPFLTAGLLLGAVLLKELHGVQDNWLSIKILGTAGLWLVFLVLLYLRYAAHVAGRRLALLTIVCFILMISVLVAAHPFASGDAG